MPQDLPLRIPQRQRATGLHQWVGPVGPEGKVPASRDVERVARVHDALNFVVQLW